MKKNRNHNVIIWEKTNFGIIDGTKKIKTTNTKLLKKYYIVKYDKIKNEYDFVGYKEELKQFIIDKVYDLLNKAYNNYHIFYYLNNNTESTLKYIGDPFVETIRKSSFEISMINLMKILDKKAVFGLQYLNTVFGRDYDLNMIENRYIESIISVLRNKHYAHSDFYSSISISLEDIDEIDQYFIKLLEYIDHIVIETGVKPKGYGRRFNSCEVNGSKIIR